MIVKKIVFESRACFNPLPTILYSLLDLTVHSPTDQFVSKVRLAYILFPLRYSYFRLIYRSWMLDPIQLIKGRKWSRNFLMIRKSNRGTLRIRSTICQVRENIRSFALPFGKLRWPSAYIGCSRERS